MTDEKIIESLKLNDPLAMQWLFERYYVPLCHYTEKYMNDMSLSEEIVSDVMFQIWKNRNMGYQSDTFQSYLFTAARNTAINYLKHEHKKKSSIEEWAEEYRSQLIDETPFEILANKELQAILEDLIASLPNTCRKVFLFSRKESLSYEDIASKMNLSVNTVKYHIKTALQKIRLGLKDFF